MKHRIFLFAAVAAMVLGACRKVPEIPFTQLQNYFVRNDAVIPEEAKIDDAETFGRLFGMAAVMGPDGMPTPVDFGREFVIAVVCPRTDRATELMPLSLRNEDGTLVFTYRQTVGGPQGWSMQPFLLIKVDRRQETPTVRLLRN